MSLARVCDKCGHIIKDAKGIKRVRLTDFDSDFTVNNNCRCLPYADVCVRCCREMFGCFISDESWSNKLYPDKKDE